MYRRRWDRAEKAAFSMLPPLLNGKSERQQQETFRDDCILERWLQYNGGCA